jgi:hypothetical protein
VVEAPDNPAFLHAPNHHELVFVGPAGTSTYCFGYQPTTHDINDHRRPSDRYCIQLIGEQYEVYDLKTIQHIIGAIGIVSIGIPVFAHTDPDAAIMWALMNQ